MNHAKAVQYYNTRNVIISQLLKTLTQTYVTNI